MNSESASLKGRKSDGYLFLDLDETLIAKEGELFPRVAKFLIANIDHKIVIVTHATKQRVKEVINEQPLLNILVDRWFAREDLDTRDWPSSRLEGLNLDTDRRYHKDLRLLPNLLEINTLDEIRGVFVGNVEDIVAAASIEGRLPLFCVDRKGAWLSDEQERVQHLIAAILGKQTEHPQNICLDWFNAAVHANSLSQFNSGFSQTIPSSNPLRRNDQEIVTLKAKYRAAFQKQGQFRFDLIPFIRPDQTQVPIWVFPFTPELEHGVYFRQY